MPIAAYTLDGKGDFKVAYISTFFFFSPDGFDVRKIRIIEPPRARKSAPTHAATIGPSNNSTEVPAVSRKRPFDNINDSSVSKEEQKQRPRKKARIDVHALVFPELYDHHPPQPCPMKKEESPPSAHDKSALKSIIQVPRFSIFPKPSGKASRAVNQRFLSQIRRQTPADEPNDIS